MEQDTNRLLKLFYANALVDAVHHYGKHGILEEVRREKQALQQQSAAGQLKQLGISELPELYTKFSAIFGCAAWKFTEEDSAEATTTTCLLCALAKKLGTERPCDLFCINPFAAFAEALGYHLEAASTLWDSPECRFVHTRIVQD